MIKKGKLVNLKHGMNSLRLHQNGKFIKGYVNGEEIGNFEILEKVTKEGKVGLYFKATRNKGGTIYFQDFILKDLGKISLVK